jgi:hypothetical protein
VKSLPLWLMLVAAGCAPPFTWRGTPHTDLRALTAKYPRAVAVVLDREDRMVFTYDGSAPATQEQRHDVIAILADGGDRWAEVAIPVGDGRLQYLHARTIGPDGHVEEVSPEEVHTGVAHLGSRVDGNNVALEVFRLPGARVGSVVEYAYGVENDRTLMYAQRPMSADIPIVHYHSEIALTGLVEVRVRVYNGHPVIKREQGHATQVARIDQYDIPAAVHEPFSPPPSVTEPCWVVAVTRRIQRYGVAGVFDSWPHAVAGVARALYETKAKDYPLAALVPRLEGCGRGRRCAVERALTLVNAKTDLSRFVGNNGEIRPLKEVLASGMANNLEKAMLLRRALEAAGLTASFVELARALDNDFDRAFPSPGRLDHLIVRVDQQPGFDQALFVDPSCEACAVGQLPPWSNDRQALVFGKPREAASYALPEAPVDIVQLHGENTVASVHRHTIDATIDPTGALRGRMTDELRGAAAVDFRITTRSWLDDRWRQELGDDLHARAQTASLGGWTRPAWDKHDARLTFAADFAAPGYAAGDGARQIVPLSFLRLEWDRDFGDEPRRHDVLVRNAERDEETLVLHLPNGSTATDLPHAAAWHSEALDASVQVTSAPGTITIRRIVQLHPGHWGPGEIDDLLEVAHEIAAVRQAAFAVTATP